MLSNCVSLKWTDYIQEKTSKQVCQQNPSVLLGSVKLCHYYICLENIMFIFPDKEKIKFPTVYIYVKLLFCCSRYIFSDTRVHASIWYTSP